MYILTSNNVTHELLEKKDIKIDTEITSLKELCNTMQSSIQNNLTEINTIKEDITTVKKNLEKNNTEITSLKELCNTMQSSIQNILKEINTIKEDITTVKKDIINIKKGATPVASEGGI